MVDGETLDTERGITYDLLKDVFGTIERVTLTAMPAGESVHLRAESESDEAVPVGLCEHQRALMFDPSDNGLEINNQHVIGLLLPLRTFARIQRDIAGLLPANRSLTGTPGQLVHEHDHDDHHDGDGGNGSDGEHDGSHRPTPGGGT
jgi:hypothetical protein